MRSRIFTVVLCLALVTSGASAMGMPATGDRGPAGSGLVDLVWTFVQDLLGMEIDPWGSPANSGVHPEGTDGSDLGPKIDPWGDENTEQQDGPAGDVGMQVDPWGWSQAGTGPGAVTMRPRSLPPG